MARVQQKFQQSNRERKTMISHPFHHALEPKIFIRLFLAVLILHLHGADAARTRCKTTKDCVDPENVQFCDENFFACMPCDDYCTGAEDTIPICMEKCPIRYTRVYGRDKQPELPKVDVPKDDPTPHKEPAPVRQNNKETSGNYSANQTTIVLGSFFAFVVVTVVASVVGWYYLRWKKQTSETGHDPEMAMDKLMDGEKDKDEDNGECKPDISEGTPENNDGKAENDDGKAENDDGKAENDDGKPENNEGKPEDNEMENKDAKTEHGQADVHPTGTDARVFNSTTDPNFAGLRSPNTSIEIEDCKGIKAAQTTTQGQPLQSNGNKPQMPKP